MLITDQQLLMIVSVLENVERGLTEDHQLGHLLARIRSLYLTKLCDTHSHCFVCCIVCSACNIFIPSSENEVSNDPIVNRVLYLWIGPLAIF